MTRTERVKTIIEAVEETTMRLTKIADDIVAEAADFPAEDRYEVLEELIRVYAEDEELSVPQTRRVFEMVSAKV